LVGSLKALLALGILAGFARMPVEAVRSMVFHYMAVGQLFFAYAARHTTFYPLPNPYLHAAVALGILVQLGVGVGVPQLVEVVPLGLDLWILILTFSVGVWLLAEGIGRLVWRKEKR
ncbi:MAG: cation transporting ATPase C-terminal domain-containing protein, partial [Thermaceae bacterium]